MNNKTTKSKIKTSSAVILTLGGIGFLFLSYYLISISLNSEYPQIAGIILGGLFGLIGLASVISLLTMDKLELDNEKLVILSILNFPKRTIYLKDIISYNEIEKENKSGTWFDLTIFTKKGKYKISSSIVSNYAQFKSILINRKPRNVNSEKIWYSNTQRNFGIGFIVIGSLFLWGCWNIYKNKDKVILSNELTTIKVKVQDNLEIKKRKSSRWIEIKAIEYPKFNFELSGNTFYATEFEDFVTNVSKGDLIELDILTDIYEKKITRIKPLTFWDKTYNYSLINIYGIRGNKHSYLTLDAYNDEHRRDSSSWGFLVFLLISLGLTVAGFYFLIRKE